MGKIKPPTAQELYKVRKEREEAEREAYLPVGLINHGNTCFMNSVLQGLIATRLLKDLVLFNPLSPESQQLLGPAARQLLGASAETSSTSLIASQRSPQLTNGHTLGNAYEQEWTAGLPLGDVFIVTIYKAWKLQRLKKRESMSPKEILSVIGRKYDQYLDFGQQDAHEFLRQLLDAMRMEEYDIIKKRQPPPPPPTKRKRSRNATVMPAPPPRVSSSTSIAKSTPLPPSPQVDSAADYVLVDASDVAHPSSASDAPAVTAPAEVGSPISELPTQQPGPELKLIPFVDMIFGGRLTSILVCQKCKHVSQSYEDFNDLSLSIKPDGMDKGERKRDKLMSFARKWRGSSNGSPGTPQFVTPAAFATANQASSAAPTGGLKSSTPQLMSPDAEEQRILGVELQRSSSVPPSPSPRSDDEDEPEFPLFETRPRSLDVKEIEVQPQAEEPKLEFAEPALDRSDRKEKGDNWAKIGRRLSLGMKKSKRESRSIERESATPTPLESVRAMASANSNNSQVFSDAETDVASTGRSRQGSLSPTHPLPKVKRSKSPHPPKPSPQEAAYLRKILSDITTPSSPFALFKPPLHTTGTSSPPAAPTAAQVWGKIGPIPNIEECLRLFTAVENLDGENMVGCRRCWKIANGVYVPPPRVNGQCVEADSDSEDAAEKEKEGYTTLQSPPGLPNRQAVSAPASPAPFSASSIASLQESSSDTVSVSSAPTTMAGESSKSRPPSLALNDEPFYSPANSPEPREGSSARRGSDSSGISSVQTPRTARPNLHTYPSTDSLHAPPRARRSRRTKESDVESMDDSSGVDSDASYSSATSSASNSPRTPRFPSPAAPLIASTASIGSSSTASKIPRSKQVIMRPAYKRYLIDTPPPVLVIHLKRFQQTNKSAMMMSFASSSGSFKKIDDFVSFPEVLDVTPFLVPKKEDFGLGKAGRSSKKLKEGRGKEERCVYRLYAVVVHIGNMLGGHYVAYTALPPPETTSTIPPPKDKETRQWAYVSDHISRLATLEEVLKSKAYICMYERI